MKTGKNKPEQAGMLARYLGGEMNREEADAYEREISVSEEDKTSIEKLKKQWSAMKGHKVQESPHTRNAWDKLHNRLLDEKLIPEQGAAGKTRLRYQVIKIAAAVLILLGVAAGFYLKLNNQPAQLVRLHTGNEENTLVKTLADGSVIYIAQNSLFSFPEEFNSTSRNVELKGEAFFDIARNPARPFIIETDEAMIEVLGTALNVKEKKGDGFELVVDRGKVKVTLKASPSHCEMVAAGEKISTSKHNLVKSKHVAAEAPPWYKKRMQFKDETLHNIFSVLNRNFNTNFVLAEIATGNHKLTVTFDNETAETMTELICMTLNLKSQTIHGAVVFFENKEGTRQN